MQRYIRLGLTFLAVVSSAGGLWSADQVASGLIKDVDAQKKQIILTDGDGKEWTFNLGDKIVINRGGKESYSELAPGDRVWVYCDKGILNSTAKYVLVQDGDSKDWELAHGKVKSYDSDKKSLLYTDDNGRDASVVVGESKVWLNNREIKFSEMRIGDGCLLIVSKMGDKRTLKSVICDRK